MYSQLKTTVIDKKPILQPTPLLVILISFKPQGKRGWKNGVQLISTSKQSWYDRIFGDEGYTLKNYYKEISGNKFYFTPAKVRNSKVPGIVKVTLNCQHPDYLTKIIPKVSKGISFNILNKALREASKYVNFELYDKNNDGYIDSNELNIVFVHAGFDYASGNDTNDKIHYGVFANQGFLPDGKNTDGLSNTSAPIINDVKLCAEGYGSYVSIGEYRKIGNEFVPHPIGTIAHELGHAIGFHDMYDYDKKVKNWPIPMMFSLMCNGCYGKICNEQYLGDCPTHVDPFQKIRAGFINIIEADKEEYIIPSITDKDSFILKINTPNPKEYFLIENHSLKGFDGGLFRRKAADYSIYPIDENYKKGGIIIWHIDENIFDKYSLIKRTNGSGLWSPGENMLEKDRHNPGIVPLFKNGFDENGLMKSTNSFYAGYPEDPFFNVGDVFNSNEFICPASGTHSLNSFYDKTLEKQYNLKIEFIEKIKDSIKIRIIYS